MAEVKKTKVGRKPVHSAKYTISINENVLALGKIAAEKDRRTFSNFCEALLARYCEEHGIE